MAARNPVVAAVERDLAEIAKLDADLADSGLAWLALSLARSMDNPKTSATARSMCARSLMDALDRLRDLAPARKESDGVDDLAAQRARRQSAARVAVAADLART